ncbi:MAG TPA: hypothetical protein VJZ71_16945 [Phycisphaerae bacterium]|nr:hypothetical protein [Phycisphaerae bacterium]
MKNRMYGCLGKWSGLCAALALWAASGQACPPEMPVPVPSLTGVWTGPVSGEATGNTRFPPLPPNPNDQTSESTAQTVESVQIVFDDSLRLVKVPLVVSAFGGSFSEQSVTVFNVGEVQTVSNSSSDTIPSGTADTNTLEFTFTTTFTVVESTATMDHFHVVYEMANVGIFNQTGTAPNFPSSSSTTSSIGTLAFDGTVVDGQLMFSADFNINGTSTNVSNMSIRTGNGFVVGSVVGTLEAN